jgi:hypothetical protein
LPIVDCRLPIERTPDVDNLLLRKDGPKQFQSAIGNASIDNEFFRSLLSQKVHQFSRPLQASFIATLIVSRR